MTKDMKINQKKKNTKTTLIKIIIQKAEKHLIWNDKAMRGHRNWAIKAQSK